MTVSLAASLDLTDALKGWAVDLFEALRVQSFDGVGISRATYGEGESRAMALVADAAAQEGLTVAYDAAANLVISLPGERSDLPFAACGSHLDSVPQGGNFDGAAGVIAGVLALVRLQRAGVVPPRTLKVYALRGEESAWFGKCYLGSTALFGKFDPADFDLTQRDSGQTLGDCMAGSGADIEVLRRGQVLVQPQDIACFVELHIEQGPVMVARGVPVGLVTGIRGNMRHPRAVVRGCQRSCGPGSLLSVCSTRDGLFLLGKRTRRRLGNASGSPSSWGHGSRPRHSPGWAGRSIHPS